LKAFSAMTGCADQWWQCAIKATVWMLQANRSASGACLEGDAVYLRKAWRDGGHIRFCGNGGYWFRPYGGSLGKAPSNQGLLPRHSVPRCGSACPHSGIAPGARRHRPSMAGGGYRGILAAVPPAQRLRSASGKGAVDQDQKPKQSNGKIKRSQPSAAPALTGCDR
jgi:hypothetical protein